MTAPGRAWMLLAGLAAAGPAEAQEGSVSIGVAARSARPDSGDVLRHQDAARGLVIPRLELHGDARGWTCALRADELRERDQRLSLVLARDRLAVRAGLDRLPQQGDAARTPYAEVGGALRLPDALQSALQAEVEAARVPGSGFDGAAVGRLLDPLGRAGRTVRLRIQRDVLGLALDGRPADDVRLSLAYSRQARKGQRRSGVGFGLQAAVEIPEPVDDVTQAVTLAGEWTHRRGTVAATLRYDHFAQHTGALAVDNPLRADDATAPGAFLGPNERTAAGAADALLLPPPSNGAVAGMLRTVLRLPARTRLVAEGGLARSWQDSSLLPPTTNDAIHWPGGALPRFEGRVEVRRGALQVSSSPWPRLTLRGRARLQQRDNASPRIDLPGIVRLDAALEDVPRRTVPYAHDDARADFSTTVRAGGFSLETGHRRRRISREFRETDRTDEAAWFAALAGRPHRRAGLRLSYERARRDFGVYDNRRSTEASRLLPRPPRLLGAARRYDQALRDRDLARASLAWDARESLVITGSWALDWREYPGSAYGLVRAQAQEAAADLAWAPPHGRWEAHASGGWERLRSVQRTRHSPLPQISVDLRNIWEADLAEDVLTLSAGGSLRARRLTVRLEADLQAKDGLADLYSAPGGIPDLAEPIPEFGDTRLARATIEVERPLGSRVRLAAGAWGESWTVRDLPEEPGPGAVAGALVLLAPERDGRVLGAFARLLVRF